MDADARAADARDEERPVRVVAELAPEALGVGVVGRIEREHVAGEVEVPLDPVRHEGQVGPEVARHDVLLRADEDGRVAHVRVALDVADVLVVVVGGDEGLARAGRVVDRQPT